MSRAGRLVSSILGIALIAAVGGVGLAASLAANRKAEDIHRDDRLTLQRSLSSLTDQYLQFAVKEAYDFASDGTWTLRPNDRRDRNRLAAFGARSSLLTHGAALSSMTGEPLNAFARAPGLPPPTDPGYAPLIGALMQRKPGVSGVMQVERVPVVAVAVPVMRDERPRAVFVAFFRADTSPLQLYNERIAYGRTGHSVLLDGAGRIVSARHASSVGKRYEGAAVLRALADGRDGVLTYRRGNRQIVAAYSPVGFAGWGGVIEQDAAEFYGPIRSSALRVQVALLALLAVAAALVVVFNHKRHVALRKAYEYKGELLANTTHELKTPITAIRGAALTLGTRWRQMQPEQVDAFLGIIHRRCDGLAKLVERILAGARLEAGRDLVLASEPVDVAGALRRTAGEFAEASPRHRIEVRAADDVWATADADAVDQVLGLLVENAIKYSPDGGEVLVAAERDGGSVVVRVKDTGIGIGSDELPHVFEPYFKASRGDRQRFAGVGLGLSIARALVHRLGGRIDVASAPGSGTTFTFTLPACSAPSAGVDSLAEAR